MEWRQIGGFPRHEVSSEGSVRNLKTGTTLLAANNRGYKQLLLWSCGKFKCVRVHALVATAFIENPFNKKHVNHKDGNKANNKVENLEWATPMENKAHAKENGMVAAGDGHGRTKIKTTDIPAIKNYIRLGLTDAAIAKKFNVYRGTIGRFINRNLIKT